MSQTDLAIRVEGLSKKYRIGGKQESYKTLRDSLTNLAKWPLAVVKRVRLNGGVSKDDETIWALKDVSFEVERGDIVGVVGRNGAGKSTLLKILSRITDPTGGCADIRGRVGSLLEVGTGFHNELTGRENIFLNAAILGMRRAEIARKFDEIVDFAEVEKFIDTPVKHYSSGMYLRLAFAVAAHLEPEILLVDEVLAVGDAAFQKKCLGRMDKVATEGRTVLFVSHNMGAIRSLCNKGLVLHDGQVDCVGDLNECITHYYHSIGALQGSSGDAETGCGAGTGFGYVVLKDVDGNTINQSQGFEANTVLRIGKPLNGFYLFATLEDMHGRFVFALREESPLLGLDDVPAGDYHIRVKFPPLWLNPGLYALHFKAMLWGQGRQNRYLSDKFPLGVEGVSSQVDAIMHPRADWSIRECVPAAASQE